MFWLVWPTNMATALENQFKNKIKLFLTPELAYVCIIRQSFATNISYNL